MGTKAAVKANPPVDDALCRRCGKCCYKKINTGRTVYITPFPCKYLDPTTNLCTVYPHRHEINPFCLSVPEGLRASAFPADCAYMRLAPPGYRPARENWDWTYEWEDFDDLAEDLGVTPEIREMVRARGPHAPPMYLEALRNVPTCATGKNCHG